MLWHRGQLSRLSKAFAKSVYITLAFCLFFRVHSFLHVIERKRKARSSCPGKIHCVKVLELLKLGLFPVLPSRTLFYWIFVNGRKRIKTISEYRVKKFRVERKWKFFRYCSWQFILFGKTQCIPVERIGGSTHLSLQNPFMMNIGSISSQSWRNSFYESHVWHNVCQAQITRLKGVTPLPAGLLFWRNFHTPVMTRLRACWPHWPGLLPDAGVTRLWRV